MQRVLAALLIAGCGGSSGGHPDGTVSARCQSEAECAAPTPICEPSTGTCVECRFSSHCTGDDKICEADHCRAAKSCDELATELPGLPSGVYSIDPGDGAFQASCELATAGGGWTLVQRTLWAWSASQALQTAYGAWHDTTIGDPGSGAYRLAGQRWPDVASRGDLMIIHRVRTTAGGACDPLYYTGSGGTLTVGDTSATLTGLTSTAPLLADPALSTLDTGPGAACVTSDGGVPWFYGSCCATCPTFGNAYWTDEPHPMQNYTSTTADLFGKTEVQACAGQTVRAADNASSYRGDDSMEVYLR
jgi:hypothetical protein